MPDDIVFSTTSGIAEIARREVERHQKIFTGVTTEKPRYRDVEGSLEFVVNVRIGIDDTWAVVEDVLIAQEVVGLVADAGIPVTMERSVAGRLRITGRSVVNLPDVALNTYTYADLDLEFMHGLTEVGGLWYDGFGHLVSTNPSTQTGSVSQVCTTVSRLVEWGSTEFIWGTTEWGEYTTERTCS